MAGETESEFSSIRRSTHFLDPEIITKKKSYSDDCETYISHRDKIAKIENDIETWPEYSKKLHESLRHVEMIGNENVEHPWHANLTANLRIIYVWDPKKKELRYISIMTKNDVDQLRKVYW